MEINVPKTVQDVIEKLTGANINFIFTGGIVSIYYGESRTTQDIDIVIQSTSNYDANKIYDAFNEEYFIDKELLEEAIQNKSMGQALHKTDFVKIDLHFGELVPGEYSRHKVIEIFPGVKAPILSREDAILSKLMWIKMGSYRSRRDVVGMLRSSKPIDESLLEQIADQLNVIELLNELKLLAQGEQIEKP
jgi:Nucleotidyl transferase AbiEii toxin, Type IV TA system